MSGEDIIRVLVVDDDEDDYIIIRELLREVHHRSYETDWLPHGRDIAGALAKKTYDICLIDYNLGGDNGIAIIRSVMTAGRSIPFILITGQDDYEVDLKAMQAGARDYLSKNTLSPDSLERSIRYAVNEHRLERERINALLELGESERALAAAARDWQNTFDAVGDAIWLLDREHRIVRVNKATRELFGVEQSAILGMYCWKVVHNTDTPLPNCPVNTAMKTKKRASLEISSGNRKFLIVADPILEKNGDYRGAVHIASDITERTRIASALAESEEKFRSIIEQSADGIALSDKDGIIIEWNHGEELITGIPRAEAMGKPAWDLQSSLIVDTTQQEAIADRMREQISLMLRNENTPNMTQETVFRRRDGEIRTMQITMFVINASHGRMVGTFTRDITEHKRVEDERLFQEKIMQRTERLASLGQISSAIGHEINQPLQSIKVIAGTAVYLHEHEQRTLSTETLIGDFKKIIERVDRLDGIIKSMRVMLKSSDKIDARPLDLNKCIHSTLDIFKQKLISHGVALTTVFSDGLGKVLFPEVQLSQVIANIVDNAVAALDNAAHEERRIVISTGMKNGSIYLSIADNGPGIPDEQKERIFNPFYSLQQKEHSMGLGLYIVTTILKSFDATIAVSDNDMGGATFTVRFAPERPA
ncbi:MAG: PAS domain S-box protein [Spirochaetes bacterium]|nr:PAS domain S-box protein [Spirochaetota bacterium]